MSTSKTLEERIARIEKIFWVIFVVAAIFGISGGLGMSILKSAKTQLDSLSLRIDKTQTRIESASTVISAQ